MAALQAPVPRENPGQGPQDPYNPAPATPGAPGIGVPAGGATNTVLIKSSATDFATTWQTVSALLDALFGSSQGNILTRNAGTWTVLAPGTIGYVLTSGGPGANVSYAPASGGVTLTPGAGIVITGGPSAYTISALAVSQPLLSYVGIGAICAYGLRQLVSTYDGPILNVTRPASGTSLQIYPAAGTLDLDTAALIAFAAGADVFVDTWYDQIGGGHMTQPIAANRPQICVAGALITLPNGRPTIKTDGVSQWLDVSSPTVNQPLTRVSVLKFLSVAAGQNLTSDNATNSLNMNAVGSLATFAGANVAFKTGIAVNDLAAVSEALNGPASRWLYNGVRGTYNPGSGATQRRSIGASFSGAAGSFFAGLYSEQIVWNRQVSRYEEQLIYENQKLYWGVP